MQFIYIWAIGAITYLLFSSHSTKSLIEVISPLVFCFFIMFFVNIYNKKNIKSIRYTAAYFLFFAVTLTSLFGFTEILTGSHAEATQPLLFGLSFYTASLAYLVLSTYRSKLNAIDVFKTSNPFLLVTGPISLFITNFRYRSIGRRFNYFFPFFIVGVFYYQIVAAPLTLTFKLIESTDVISSLLFASIFELFVYTNFCGLSLIIYGVFGILGLKIPLNFRQPFSSSNLIEFWRGWHTSLSTVLKTLFYSPLRASFSSSVAILGVYLASALWHGFALNFIIWGIFHAAMFIITIHVLKKRIPYLPLIILMVAVVLGRLIFADSQTDRLIEKLTFSYTGFGAIQTLLSMKTASKISLLLGFCLISVEFFFRNSKNVCKRNYKHLRSPITLFILVATGVTLASDLGNNFAVYGQR